MQKTKIKADSHGLYIKSGGHVFRPIPGKHSYPTTKAVNGNSQWSEGTEVKATHVSQTPFGKLRVGDSEEWWHSHGFYLAKVEKSSEDCWQPDQK